jgi:hypothetical protein
MKKMTGDSYLLIGIMVCAVAFGLTALTYPDLKTKLVPATVSAIVFLLAGIQLVKELSQKERPNQESKADATAEKSSESVFWRENLIGFSWLAGYLVVLYLVGFHMSTLLLVFSYMKLNRFGWTKSIFTAVLATVLIYVVFVVVLEADLFSGVIIDALSARF